MKFLTSKSALALYGVALMHATPGHSYCSDGRGDADLTVKIQGGTVHGTTNSTTPDVREFLGIPYGLPPVGKLRFTKPRPAKPFGEMDAKTPGPNCMQYLGSNPGVYQTENTHYNTPGPFSEDCLTLSVWAPRQKGSLETKKQKKLPVILWIYGGGFQTGGKDIPYLIPSKWIQRSQSHIVVAINYRVDIFGYSNAAGIPDDEQNVGLLDQRLGAEWVRDNIEAFGGDPARITLWGQSAGAISVGYYSYAYPDDPIVSALIMDSGGEYLDITSHDATHSNFTFVASKFGCGGLEPAVELDCMRGVDAQAIEDFLHTYGSNGTQPALTFTPVVDGKTVFANYTKRALAGKVAKVPSIIGSNTEDGIPFVPYNPTGPNTTAAYSVTLNAFFCTGWKSATDRLKLGLPVYRYEYAGNFSNVSPKGWMGAYHSAEQPLVFGTHADFGGASTELEWATSCAMQDAWVAFISSEGGKGLAETQGWPVYVGVEGGVVREFGRGAAARTISKREMEKMCSAAYQP